MTTSYGLPLMLEDKTGLLTGSEFTDLEGRMRLSYRLSAHNAAHTAYMIYYAAESSPVIALDFFRNNTLGNITLSLGHPPIPMQKYLEKVGNNSRVRRFRASNRQEYTWSWRSQENQEWTCTTAQGYIIANYDLKCPGEPHYENSSGCILTVEEEYSHLAPEMLASLMIMRHIAEYRL